MSAPGRSYNKYQFETSPRKIQPREEPQRIPNKPKKSSTASKKNKQEEKNNAKVLAAKTKAKMVICLVIRFCYALCYWF